LSIESLSSLKASDISRSSRDKSRDLKSEKNQDYDLQNGQVSIIRTGDTETFEKAASFNQQTDSLSKNSLNEKVAIAAYQSVSKEQQRYSIQLLLGVDTFV
jgi:patatin-like phospholipase/acyl hydrolase